MNLGFLWFLGSHIFFMIFLFIELRNFYIPEFHCHLLIDDSICNGIRDKVNIHTLNIKKYSRTLLEGAEI